jgi:hypothetical protein
VRRIEVSKTVVNMLNEMADIVYGYPKQVADLDADGKVVIVSNDIFCVLEESLELLKNHRMPTVPSENQLTLF